ncbi:putative LRR receptor-like serine/threonine-protein kinase [Citrus sinensis]|nr:putative LRR receptor-like serine/threonine-protein kinase [Citrus sinensis]
MGIRWPCLCSFSALYAAVLVFSLPIVSDEFLWVRASLVAGTGNETDRVALLEFKSKSTYDPVGVLGTWNESIHFCKWYGVTCSRRHQRVTLLDLRSLKLAGSVSHFIGNLSFLKQLYLQVNSFTHEIPSEIGGLRRLKVLALNNNSICGEIPTNISRCSTLIPIHPQNNQLVGKILSRFSSLSKTEILNLGSNHLTGSIPSSLGNLSSIHTISLAYNNLDGTIPNSFGWFENLVFLSLAANNLSGIIPSSIFNISSIVTFDVGLNQIQGIIPLDFVVENKLTGEVPSLEKLQRLQHFTITSNSLGSGGNDDLSFLCSLTNATRLTWMHINSNNFGGLLPGCISNLSKTIKTLFLNNNKIYGSIPAGIGNFVNLQRLDMWNNQLSGTIPPAIGELQNLKILGLNRNKLSGNIPPSIGNLKMLLNLFLNDNFLEVSIPSSLGQCESLIEINLSNNNLSGTIPPQFFSLSSLSISLDWSRNKLTGSLPIEVGKLKILEFLYVYENRLEGEIPSTFGNCIRLEQLGMGGNLFQGPISSSLGSLRGLRVLDLSQNNLSGEIPKFLAGLSLNNLNLSYNDLEGMVTTEGVFKNASATRILGNSKLCGGISEFKLPTCVSKKSKRRRLTFVPTLVIAIVFRLLGLALALFGLVLCLVRKIKEKENPSSSIYSLLYLSYQDLYNATSGFSSANLVGVGSFGSVYKGIIDEGRTTIAVKVFNLQHHGASRSFIAECKALKSIRHRNLVKVLTACLGADYRGNDFKASVYEFMHYGSLEEWLHPFTGEDEIDEAPRNLNLLQRLNIAIDIAYALNYLHHDCQPVTAHCDLKPSNVLLDDYMTARVGDFGLARILSPDHTQTSSFSVKGSLGYIAPEYGVGCEVSTNGDVYSYGILLLELVIGKKPIDIMFEGDINLHNFGRKALPDDVMDIVDSSLLPDDEDLILTGNQRQKQARINSIIECLISMVRIGVACSMELPQDRTNMTNVVHELQSIKNILLGVELCPPCKVVIE